MKKLLILLLVCLNSYAQDTAQLQKLAEQNNIDAQYELATILLEQNDQKAVHWLARASALGDPDAQRELGVLYIKGHMVKQDTTLAVKLLEQAAAQYDVEAQHELRLLRGEITERINFHAD